MKDWNFDRQLITLRDISKYMVRHRKTWLYISDCMPGRVSSNLEDSCTTNGLVYLCSIAWRLFLNLMVDSIKELKLIRPCLIFFGLWQEGTRQGVAQLRASDCKPGSKSFNIFFSRDLWNPPANLWWDMRISATDDVFFSISSILTEIDLP